MLWLGLNLDFNGGCSSKNLALAVLSIGFSLPLFDSFIMQLELPCNIRFFLVI